MASAIQEVKLAGQTPRQDGPMVNKASYYKLALWITLLLTLTELVLFLYVASINFERAVQAVAIRVFLPLAILLGIWLQSNIARYLGVIWLLISAGSVVWSLFSIEPVASIWWVIWAFAVVFLSLPLTYILVFSKKFAEEFASLRDKQPQYKTVLKRLVAIVLIAAAAIAVYNDVVHVASRWTAWWTATNYNISQSALNPPPYAPLTTPAS